jgi:putative transposase
MRALPRRLNMRAELVFRRVRRCIARAHRGGLRVTHFSVQRDHVHLIVEASDRRGIARGIQGIASGVARAVNGMARRSGRFWRDRYHRHDLVTPREVRNAIVYVTMNVRKHGVHERGVMRKLDARSSAAWLEGWQARAGPWLDALARERLVREALRDARPVEPSATWLGTAGWKRHGLIAPDERPVSAS